MGWRVIMEITKLLKAMADETRFKIIMLLLQHNYCVKALSKKLELSESAISQHIKVLREAGLLLGVKKGYFKHYYVDRDKLHELASQLKELAEIEQEVCSPGRAGCQSSEWKRCHLRKDSHNYSSEEQFLCHGEDRVKGRVNKYGNCQCHKS